MCCGRPYGVVVTVGPHRLSPSGVPLPPPRRVSAVPRMLPLTPLLPWPHLSVPAARTQLTVRGLDIILSIIGYRSVHSAERGGPPDCS